MKDFTLLEETEHMLQWLSSSPYEEIWGQVEQILQQQVEGDLDGKIL